MQQECSKPGCHDKGDNTYRGENGNSVKVCDLHYWQLVTGNRTQKFDTGVRSDLHTPRAGDFLERIGGAEPQTTPSDDIRITDAGSINGEIRR